MPLTDQEWHNALSIFKEKDIEERIALLRSRIRNSQQEIVALAVILAGVKRGDELRKISTALADQAINEALEAVKAEARPLIPPRSVEV